MTRSIVGKKFDRLLVTGVHKVVLTPSGSRKYQLTTRCDCGATHLVWEMVLRRQKTSMCTACRTRLKPICSHPLSSVWNGLNDRCHNPNSTMYKHYGGRGIEVCQAWRRSSDALASRAAFWRFVADMGERPDGFTIERLDVNKGYSPDNCVWLEPAKQQLNKQNTRIADGKKLADLERAHGLAIGSITATAKRLGVPVEAAVDALKHHSTGRVAWKRLLGLHRAKKAVRANIHNMKRYNFYLPEALVAEAQELAAKRGTSVSEVLRRSLDAYLKAWKARNGQQ